MSGQVKTEKDGSVCTVTLENAGKRNAISYGMMDALTETFEDLEDEDDHYVVVLRGAGNKAFSSGFDLSQAESRFDRNEEQVHKWGRMTDAIDSYEYPTIAMINGVTYGGGMEVISACDLRIGADDTEFGITPAKLGSVYSGRAIQRVMDLVGPAYTKEFLFTATPMGAERASEIGLLNKSVPRSDLEGETYDLATTMAANAPLSLMYMKDICRTIENKASLTDKEHQWITRVRDEAYKSDDHQEAVAAFGEDWEPEFKGE